MAVKRKWTDVEYQADRIWDKFRFEAKIEPTQFASEDELNAYLDTTFASHNMLRRLGSTGIGLVRDEALNWWNEGVGIIEAGEAMEEEIKEVGEAVEEPVTIEIPETKEVAKVGRGKSVTVTVPKTKAEPITIEEYEIPEKVTEAAEGITEVAEETPRTQMTETENMIHEMSETIKERTRTPTVSERVTSVVNSVRSTVTSIVGRIRGLFGRR